MAAAVVLKVWSLDHRLQPQVGWGWGPPVNILTSFLMIRMLPLV